MADNVLASAAVGTGSTFATKDILGIQYPRNILVTAAGVDISPLAEGGNVAVSNFPASQAVTGTFWQATQPVSGSVTVNLISGFATEATLAARIPVNGQALMAASVPVTLASNQSAVPVSGPLTDTQLRAATVPVSGTVTVNTISGFATETTLAALNAKFGALGQALMAASAPVVIASNQSAIPVSFTQPALVAGSAIIGKVGIDQTTPGTTNLVSIGTNGTVAINAALPAGANVIGSLAANQSVNVAQMNGVATTMGNGVAGTGVQRVAIASDNTAFSVNATPPTLTKGSQGTNGNSVQQLRDAGRAFVNAATAIAGVTAVTAEALLTLNVSRDAAATAAVTTIAVTSGKRLRIIGVTCGMISTGAAVLSVRVSLRVNPSGVAAATSPILLTIPLSSGAALAQAGNEMTVMFPEAIELSGTMQCGLSQVASAITGTVWASLISYEY